MIKNCNKCNSPKSLELFYNDRTKKFGKSSWCKECTSKHHKNYRLTPSGKLIEYKRRFSTKRKASQRRRDLKKYNMTPEDYDKILEQQNGVCAICKNPPNKESGSRSGKRLAVDHDHNTNRVRGALV